MPNCVFCEQDNAGTFSACQKCGAPLPDNGTQKLSEAVVRSRLLELLADGNKIQAIAAYRRHSGASLTVAVEYIETLDSDQEFAEVRPVADVEREVGKLLERGEKIEAVKLYRDRMGVELKVAKDEVEALERRLGLAPDEDDPKAGCTGMLLLLGTSSWWITQLFVPYLSTHP